MCDKSYTASISPAGLTTFSLDSSTKKFQVYSDSYSQIKTYTVTLRGYITSATTQFAETTFTVTVSDPCLTTTLDIPSI